MISRYVLVFVASLPLWLLQGCSSLEQVMQGREPKVQIEGARLAGLDFNGVDLIFDLNIDNPNPFAIDLTGFDYDLQLFDRSFLKGRQSRGVSLGARSESRVQVPLRLGFEQLLSSYRQLRHADRANYRLDLGLGFKMPVIGTLRLPVGFEGELPIPRVPDIRIRSLALERLSLEKAELVLQIEVDNPNSFTLLLQQLNYQLKLNGAAIAKGLVSEPSTVERGGRGLLSIPLSIDLVQAGMGLYSALLRRSGIQYELSGAVDGSTPDALLERFHIPLAKQGTITLQ